MAATDMELGPCQVLFNNVDLGGTLGITVTIRTVAADLKRDQFGSEAYDKVVTGMGAEIKCRLVDINYANLSLVLNQSYNVGGGDKAIAGKNLVGTKLSTKAFELVLKKYVGGVPSTDEDDWILFRKAFPLSDIELSYDAENQRVLEVTFNAMQDTQGYLYIFGKEAIAS